MAIRLLSSESISGSLTVSGTLGLSGTTAQYVRGDGAFTTLPLIPSDNVTGTGVAGKVAYWTSANIIDDGPITFSGVNVIFDSRNIIPSIDANLTLGTGALRWNFAYINNALSVTDGNINAGTTFDFNQGANFLGNLNLTNTGSNPKITLVESSGGTQNAVIEFDQAGDNQLYITTNYVSPSDSSRILLQPGSYPALTASGGANGAINTKVEISGTLQANRNIQTINSNLSTTAAPTNFGVYTSEVRLIDTPNGGLQSCRVITDNFGEWIVVGRFAASAMTSIQSTWSSVSGMSLGTSQSESTQFSADFGDSFPEEVRIMGSTDFTKWRDNRTVDFIYKVPEGRQWKYFFSGGATNGMTSQLQDCNTGTRYGWSVNGTYDGFGRWVNAAQTRVGMSDTNVTNPSAAYTTATANAFYWETALDAKFTVSATRPYSGQDCYATAAFGNDDNIQGFFDEYPNESFNMNGGVDFSSAAWVLIKLPEGASGSGGSGGGYWAANGSDIYNKNSGKVGINTAAPDADLQVTTVGTSSQDGIIKIGGSAASLGLVLEYDQVDATFSYITANPTYTSNTSIMKIRVDGDANPDQLVLTGAGNVGIGTEDPSAKLHVRTSTDHNFEFEETGGELRISALNDARTANIPLQFAASQFNFITGNVGIGMTTAPVGDLHLQGGQQDIVLTNTAADGVAGLTISRIIGQARGYSNNLSVMQSIDFETNSGFWYKGDIVFKTNNTDGTDTSVAATERMRIDSSGNISFNQNNTTQLGKYIATNSGGAVHTIRMRQGGEIHFGDTSVGAPLGLTEGLWNVFTDQDYLSVYSRNRFEFRGYGGHLGLVSSAVTWFFSTYFNIGSTSASGARLNVTSQGSGTQEVVQINHGSGSHTGIGLKIVSANSGHAMDLSGSAGAGFARLTTAYNANPTFSVSGDIIAYASSDIRYKDNLKVIKNPLQMISKINGYTFDWNNKQDVYKGKDYGVVAQEIEEIMPEIVDNRWDGYKAVKYEKIAPLLIEAIKELKQEIDELKKHKCNCKE